MTELERVVFPLPSFLKISFFLLLLVFVSLYLGKREAPSWFFAK